MPSSARSPPVVAAAALRFAGVWCFCPDPVDFRAYELVNIYDDENAYGKPGPFGVVPRPAKRDPDGHVTDLYTVTSVPTILLVAENGIVVRRWEGFTGVMSGLEPVVNRLLPPATSAAKPASRGCSDGAQ